MTDFDGQVLPLRIIDHNGSISIRCVMPECNFVEPFNFGWTNEPAANAANAWALKHALYHNAKIHGVECPNPWHSSAPARETIDCPECPSRRYVVTS